MLYHLIEVTSPVSHGRDYITSFGGIITTMLGVIGSVLVALIQSNRRLTKRGMEAAETAADRAGTAAERAEPTGNGYADRTEKALARIEATQLQQSRDIGGIREEQRTERLERIALARALSAHIERND